MLYKVEIFLTVTVSHHLVNIVRICSIFHVDLFKLLRRKEFIKCRTIKQLYGKNTEFIICPEENGVPNLESSLIPSPFPEAGLIPRHRISS